MATERNDNWQPVSKISVGLSAATTSQANVKEFAVMTGRRRMILNEATNTITAARTIGGLNPVNRAYASKRPPTSHAPRRRRTPASLNVHHKKNAKITRCCPEIASTWMTPVRIYLSQSSNVIVELWPRSRAAATPLVSGGRRSRRTFSPHPRTQASQPQKDDDQP